MCRLSCVWIAAAALLLAAPALASVPFPDNCIVSWFANPATDIIFTCPAGDESQLDVTVLDQFGLPIPLQTVTVTFGNATQLCAAPIAGATSASGYVRLSLPIGTISTAASPRITSTYTVTVMGYTIKSGTVTVMSADYDCAPIGSPQVTALDFSFFATDWLMTGAGLRSDFNNDGAVDALDYSMWAMNWLHM